MEGGVGGAGRCIVGERREEGGGSAWQAWTFPGASCKPQEVTPSIGTPPQKNNNITLSPPLTSSMFLRQQEGPAATTVEQPVRGGGAAQRRGAGGHRCGKAGATGVAAAPGGSAVHWDSAGCRRNGHCSSRHCGSCGTCNSHRRCAAEAIGTAAAIGASSHPGGVFRGQSSAFPGIVRQDPVGSTTHAMHPGFRGIPSGLYYPLDQRPYLYLRVILVYRHDAGIPFRRTRARCTSSCLLEAILRSGRHA